MQKMNGAADWKPAKHGKDQSVPPTLI